MEVWLNVSFKPKSWFTCGNRHHHIFQVNGMFSNFNFNQFECFLRILLIRDITTENLHERLFKDHTTRLSVWWLLSLKVHVNFAFRAWKRQILDMKATLVVIWPWPTLAHFHSNFSNKLNIKLRVFGLQMEFCVLEWIITQEYICYFRHESTLPNHKKFSLPTGALNSFFWNWISKIIMKYVF